MQLAKELKLSEGLWTCNFVLLVLMKLPWLTDGARAMGLGRGSKAGWQMVCEIRQLLALCQCILSFYMKVVTAVLCRY